MKVERDINLIRLINLIKALAIKYLLNYFFTQNLLHDIKLSNKKLHQLNFIDQCLKLLIILFLKFF